MSKGQREQRDCDISHNKGPAEGASEGGDGDGQQDFTEGLKRRSTGSGDLDGCGLEDCSQDGVSREEGHSSSSVDHELETPGTGLGCDLEKWQAAHRRHEDLPYSFPWHGLRSGEVRLEEGWMARRFFCCCWNGWCCCCNCW